MFTCSPRSPNFYLHLTVVGGGEQPSHVRDCLVRLCHQWRRLRLKNRLGRHSRWTGSPGTQKWMANAGGRCLKDTWGRERPLNRPTGFFTVPGEERSPPGVGPWNLNMMTDAKAMWRGHVEATSSAHTWRRRERRRRVYLWRVTWRLCFWRDSCWSYICIVPGPRVLCLGSVDSTPSRKVGRRWIESHRLPFDPRTSTVSTCSPTTPPTLRNT